MQMKLHRSVAVALWLLEHGAASPSRSALAGDLLEQLNEKRSTGWLWRQVLAVMAIRAMERTRALVSPVMFSLAWSTVFSAWTLFAGGRYGFSLSGLGRGAAWPSSAVLQIGLCLFPIVAFAWTGILVFQLLRT